MESHLESLREEWKAIVVLNQLWIDSLLWVLLTSFLGFLLFVTSRLLV